MVYSASDTIIVSQQDAKKGKLPHEDYEFLASINLKKTGRGDGKASKIMQSTY